MSTRFTKAAAVLAGTALLLAGTAACSAAVSYTHLTLPTNREV